MFIIFISCITFIIFYNSLSLWLVGLVKTKSQMLSPWNSGDISSFLLSLQLKTRAFCSYFQVSLWRMKPSGLRFDNLEDDVRGLLDLPELPLHRILDRLSPEDLCAMATVCTSLRDQCMSDYYWEKHLKQKWGRILCEAVYKEWQCYIAARNRSINLSRQIKQKSWLTSILSVLPSYIRMPDLTKSCEPCNELQLKESTMDLYLALESGKFWFPAQVYNRENGHAGFMLSCYDAKVRYESTSDTFHARYLPHGRQTLEENIEWGRLRTPLLDTPANALHISDCLAALQPGDHIEIQWRRNKEFPYGWWYGVVGHLETCDGVEYHCRCRQSDTAVLEFKQYAQGSRWRKTFVNRHTHREEGNTVDGFYGGIRKLCNNEEISTWKLLWPPKILE